MPLFNFTSFFNFCTIQDLKERCVTVDDEKADDKVDFRQSEPEMRKATDLSGSAVMGTAVIFLSDQPPLYCIIAHHLHYLPNYIIIRKEKLKIQN